MVNVPMVVSPALPNALAMALDDEYRARATYQAVVDTHGPVLPFANIVHAEERHIAALLPLFERYAVPLPLDRWFGNVPPQPNLQADCEAAVAGEIRNYQMYDQLLMQVHEPDVQMVFSNLRNASANHHLPAFQACAAAYPTTGAVPATPVSAASEVGGHLIAAGVGMLAGAGVVWLASRLMGTADG